MADRWQALMWCGRGIIGLDVVEAYCRAKMEVEKVEKYFKDGIEFIRCISLSGKQFFVAFKNGYNIVADTENEIIKTYERLGI